MSDFYPRFPDFESGSDTHEDLDDSLGKKKTRKKSYFSLDRDRKEEVDSSEKALFSKEREPRDTESLIGRISSTEVGVIKDQMEAEPDKLAKDQPIEIKSDVPEIGKEANSVFNEPKTEEGQLDQQSEDIEIESEEDSDDAQEVDFGEAVDIPQEDVVEEEPISSDPISSTSSSGNGGGVNQPPNNNRLNPNNPPQPPGNIPPQPRGPNNPPPPPNHNQPPFGGYGGGNNLPPNPGFYPNPNLPNPNIIQNQPAGANIVTVPDPDAERRGLRRGRRQGLVVGGLLAWAGTRWNQGRKRKKMEQKHQRDINKLEKKLKTVEMKTAIKNSKIDKSPNSYLTNSDPEKLVLSVEDKNELQNVFAYPPKTEKAQTDNLVETMGVKPSELRPNQKRFQQELQQNNEPIELRSSTHPSNLIERPVNVQGSKFEMAENIESSEKAQRDNLEVLQVIDSVPKNTAIGGISTEIRRETIGSSTSSLNPISTHVTQARAKAVNSAKKAQSIARIEISVAIVLGILFIVWLMMR